MGIRFECPNGHKLNVKAHLAGQRGICPQCEAKFVIPQEEGEDASGVDAPSIDVPSIEVPSVEVPSVETSKPIESDAPSGRTRPMRQRRSSSKRSRRDRARSLTFVLGGLVLFLFAALVLVLLN